jgi:hypothetical protein
VENLILSNSTFSGPGGVGGIAGLLGDDGTIRNCRVEGSVSIVASQDNSLGLGGVVGYISKGSTVIGCVSAATVSAGDYSDCRCFGGIAGFSNGTIQDCLYTGTSVSGADFMGAIVGCRYEDGVLLNNKYTAIDLGGVSDGIYSYDIDGARNALAIGAADGVTVTPLGDATTYDVSGITTYAGYGYIGCGDTIYFDGSVQTMTLNISYSGVPEGKVISYSDGNGNALTANADGTYTLTMNDAAVTITPDFWSVVDGRDGSTAEKAYIITTTDGLDYLAAMVNRGTRYEDTYFELGADIAYDGSLENNFTPIGCFSDDTANKFYGHFDGKGHTISGIRIKQGDGSRSHNYQALFGYTSSTAVICNLTLADTRIVGYDYSGGIVGYNDGGTITNCHATATVSILTPAIITYFHGGIVGSNHNGTVTGCTSAATVSSDGYDNIEDYGILVGYNNGGTIQDCFVYGGAVSGTKYVGAIVGEDKSGTLINNYHTLSDVGGVGIKDKVTGSDMAGALQALAIGTADGLAITPLGDATTYDVSDITVYSGNSGIIYHGTLYAGATEQVTFTISYSVPTGYEFIAYTDGNGNALGVSELGDSYLLTMTDVAATVTPIVKKRLENLFSGSNAWTGYVSEEDLALPDGLTAYVISALGDETATATEIEYIPQGMAVLLRRDNTEVNLYLASAGSGSEPGDNLLRAASPTSQPTAYRDYILFRDAFVLASEGTLATGKVYLPVQGNSKSRATACTIVIDGETTSLREVNGEEAETGAWYDLQGRKYDGKPTKKGVYIHNGKKVAIK